MGFFKWLCGTKRPNNAQTNLVPSNPPKRKACPNCGGENFLECDSFSFECRDCGFSEAKTWEDFGIKGVEELPSPPRRNPNPQKISFCELLAPLDSTIQISKEAYASQYKGGVRKLLELIRSGEEGMRAYGICPAPRPFADLAILARKLKDYDLEIAVCERAMVLAKMHDEIVEKNNFGQIRFSSTSINKVIARLPKARELAKKMKEL